MTNEETRKETGITKEDAIRKLNSCNDIEQWCDIGYEIKSKCYDKKIANLSIEDAKILINMRLDEICSELLESDSKDKMIRLRRGEDYPDKIIKVTASEYFIMAKLVAKYGTLYDARMSDEEAKLIYSDIELRKDETPKTYDTFYMRER